jgi:hypothetical protein
MEARVFMRAEGGGILSRRVGNMQEITIYSGLY